MLYIPAGILSFAGAFFAIMSLAACTACDNACDGVQTDIEMGSYTVSFDGNSGLEIDGVDVSESAVIIHMASGEDHTWEVSEFTGS